MKEKSQEATQK